MDVTISGLTRMTEALTPEEIALINSFDVNDVLDAWNEHEKQLTNERNRKQLKFRRKCSRKVRKFGMTIKPEDWKWIGDKHVAFYVRPGWSLHCYYEKETRGSMVHSYLRFDIRDDSPKTLRTNRDKRRWFARHLPWRIRSKADVGKWYKYYLTHGVLVVEEEAS